MVHITRVRTRDGKIYEGIILNVEDGLNKEPPYITLRTFKYGDIDILLMDIVSAITKGERVGVGRIEDVDELPKWLKLYKEFSKQNKK